MIEKQFQDLQTYLREHKGLAAEMQRLSDGGHLVTVKNFALVHGWRDKTVDVRTFNVKETSASAPASRANGARPEGRYFQTRT